MQRPYGCDEKGHVKLKISESNVYTHFQKEEVKSMTFPFSKRKWKGWLYYTRTSMVPFQRLKKAWIRLGCTIHFYLLEVMRQCETFSLSDSWPDQTYFLWLPPWIPLAWPAFSSGPTWSTWESLASSSASRTSPGGLGQLRLCWSSASRKWWPGRTNNVGVG